MSQQPGLLARSRRVLVLAPAALALAVGAFGCAASARPAASTPPPAPAPLVPVESGFLSVYSSLQPSEQFASLLIYRDESHKGGYRKLLFAPVEVWRSADRRLEDVPEEDLQYLADSLYQAIDARLRASFEMVTEPGPGVLEIHLAFTLVTNPDSSLDFFSTQVPVRDLAPRSGALAEGTGLFLRDCALEAEFLEGAGGKAAASKGSRRKAAGFVRAAFFDARRGAETPKGSVETWGQVAGVFEKWAALLDERLHSLRDGTFKPRLTVRKEAGKAGAAAKP